MQTFRAIAHLSFEIGAALLYAASITLVVASALFVTTQMLIVALATALACFLGISAFWGRRIWRRRRGSPHAPLFAH
jgi:hypothetical protein